jgi:hypothetical protein
MKKTRLYKKTSYSKKIYNVKNLFEKAPSFGKELGLISQANQSDSGMEHKKSGNSKKMLLLFIMQPPRLYKKQVTAKKQQIIMLYPV